MRCLGDYILSADELANLLTGGGIIIASVALLIGLWVSRLSLSQAKQLSDSDAARALEQYERERFDELVGQAKEILLLAGNIAAYTDWRFQERANHGDENTQAQRASEVEQSVAHLNQLVELLMYTNFLIPELELEPQSTIADFGYEKDPVKRVAEQAAWLSSAADLYFRYDNDVREGVDPSTDENVSTNSEAVDMLLMRLIENLPDLVSDDHEQWKWYRAARRQEITSYPPMASADMYGLSRTEFGRSLTQFRRVLGDLFAAIAEARRTVVTTRRAAGGRWTTAKGVAYLEPLPGSAPAASIGPDPFGREALEVHLKDIHFPGADTALPIPPDLADEDQRAHHFGALYDLITSLRNIGKLSDDHALNEELFIVIPAEMREEITQLIGAATEWAPDLRTNWEGFIATQGNQLPQ